MSGGNARTKEGGFTLVELMIVVLIVAILIAVAIPTFLGQRKTAEDAAAKSNLKLALTTEKAYATGAQVFTADLDALNAIEPSLFNVTGAAPATNAFDPVKVTVDPTETAVCLVAQTPTGRFLAIWESIDAGTQFGTHTTNPFGACSAAGPPAAGTWSAAGW